MLGDVGAVSSYFLQLSVFVGHDHVKLIALSQALHVT